MKPLLWIDLETTGLDPTKDLILEIGAVATGPDLEVQGEFHAVLHHIGPVLESRLMLNETVRKMHTDNTLLVECQCHDASEPSAAYYSFKEWLDLFGFCGRPIAGSNPGFDRGFLKVQMPEVAFRLHYRSFDTNTLHYFFEWDKDKNRKTAHRALDDIYDDIDAVKRYRVAAQFGLDPKNRVA